MPITRAKATTLLNQREMALFDDSRANALRKLDEKALSARITRARAGRDRARDLVQRQKLSSRAATGSKRGTSGVANARSGEKAELMADILARFEAQLTKCQASAAAPAKATKQAAASKAAKAPASKATKAPAKAVRKTARRRAVVPATAAASLTKPNRTRQRVVL